MHGVLSTEKVLCEDRSEHVYTDAGAATSVRIDEPAREATAVVLPTSRIRHWATFHDVFAETFGFPDFYGRNMDAWNDCMASLDSRDDGMTTVHCADRGVVTLQLEDANDFAARCPDQYAAVIECSAFVNWARAARGRPPVLALSFSKAPP